MAKDKGRLATRARAHATRLLAADAASLLPQDELTNLQRYLLRADLALLAALPRRMITAARRIRGAQERRKTATRELATACQWVRGQISDHFRGWAWDWLRREFAQGLVIVPERSDLLVTAQLIVKSYTFYPSLAQHASQAKVRPRSIDRIRRLIALVQDDEVPALQEARRDLIDQRDAAAERILATWPGRQS